MRNHSWHYYLGDRKSQLYLHTALDTGYSFSIIDPLNPLPISHSILTVSCITSTTSLAHLDPFLRFSAPVSWTIAPFVPSRNPPLLSSLPKPIPSSPKPGPPSIHVNSSSSPKLLNKSLALMPETRYQLSWATSITHLKIGYSAYNPSNCIPQPHSVVRP